jgi:signal transduction histidine kinase
MDRTEGKPLENVIFAVEDINDERSETQSLARRLEKAEAATTASNSFLSMASGDLQAPVREIIEIDEKILRESGEEKIRAYAETLQRTANRMLTLINGLAHRAEAAAANGKPATGRYSLRQAAEAAIGMVRPMAEKKQLRLETEIAENLPDTLIGDEEKLKEITVSLLANAVNHSTDGSIRLSVFGKVLGENVHLLVSVRALPKDEVSFGELPDPKAVRVDNDLDLEVAGALLASLHSELKSVRSTDAWKDLYFETEQRIAEDNDK